MSQRLAGKTALVTAAAAGIGKQTAIAFAEAGASVIATDINAEALQDVASAHENISAEILDVTNAEAIEAIAKRPFDILFNCAGMVANGNILDCDERDWDRSLSLNVTSMYRLNKAIIPGMVERGNGSIINVSSVASSVIGAPNRFAYGVTKAAVVGMTKSIAVDFVSKGVRCNAICPGTIQTPSLDDRINAFDDPVAARADFISRQPMGRLGKPEEVAALGVYLASDESAFTTGVAHVIDGGWSAA